jgi:hypothetical protein
VDVGVHKGTRLLSGPHDFKTEAASLDPCRMH